MYDEHHRTLFDVLVHEFLEHFFDDLANVVNFIQPTRHNQVSLAASS